MYKLNSENQIIITEEVVTKILSKYSISDFTFRPINEGIANTSLIIGSSGKKYVLRIYSHGKNPDKNIIFEIKFQDYLREKGIPIPLIYPNSEDEELTIVEINGKQWQCILMQFIEGQSVTSPSKELLAELAELQAKIHLFGIKFAEEEGTQRKLWANLHDSLAKEIKNIPENSKEVLEFIERVKTYSYPLNPELPYGYNHLDIDFDGNVITIDNHINGIIDFEDLSYSPTIVCLGFTMWNILDDQGLEPAKYYLNEYEKIRPLTPLEYEALPNVIFFRNYAIGMIRLLLWEKNTPMKDIMNILKLEKEIPRLRFSQNSI